MLDHETRAWLAGRFANTEMNGAEIHQRCEEILEAHATVRPEIVYELAQVSSDAAFYLILLYQQQQLNTLVPEEHSSGFYLVTTDIFPLLPAKKIAVIKNATVYTSASTVRIERPLAFHLLQWATLNRLALTEKLFSIDSAALYEIGDEVMILKAALVAGEMKRSYDLAYNFSFERIQGGRQIKDWSLIQQLLATLYLQAKNNEAIISSLSLECALNILRTSDQFENQCMQVMGGAGYTEDFLLEKYFREVHFLKNWPDSFAQKMIEFYRNKVLSL